MACQPWANRQGFEQGLADAPVTLAGAEGARWCVELRQSCIHDDDVSFYNSTASTWTLATPRTTWEFIIS